MKWKGLEVVMTGCRVRGYAVGGETGLLLYGFNGTCRLHFMTLVG